MSAGASTDVRRRVRGTDVEGGDHYRRRLLLTPLDEGEDEQRIYCQLAFTGNMSRNAAPAFRPEAIAVWHGDATPERVRWYPNNSSILRTSSDSVALHIPAAPASPPPLGSS